MQIIPMYMLRAVGGCLYLTGAVLMAINLWKTAASGKFVPEEEAKAAPIAATLTRHLQALPGSSART